MFSKRQKRQNRGHSQTDGVVLSSQLMFGAQPIKVQGKPGNPGKIKAELSVPGRDVHILRAQTTRYSHIYRKSNPRVRENKQLNTCNLIRH